MNFTNKFLVLGLRYSGKSSAVDLGYKCAHVTVGVMVRVVEQQVLGGFVALNSVSPVDVELVVSWRSYESG